MSETLKFGNGQWAVKEGSALAYNSENGNFKPLPFTFDRSTSATRVNKQGLIEVVSNNEPRIDFLNDSKGALLLEPSRNNLITYSEDFSQSYWTKNLASITSDSVISPNGTLDASKLISSNDGLNSRIEVLPTLADNTVYTSSIFVKKGDLNFISINLRDKTGITRVAYFDINNGVLTSTLNSPQDTNIEYFGNDWYRVSISVDSLSGGTQPRVQYVLASADGDVDTGLNTFLYIWGAQLEEGSYVTSYIPTQGQSGGVTRVAEQGIDGGAGTPIFSNTSAVWFIDLERIGVDTDSSGSAMALRNSSFSQQIRLHFDAPTTNIRFRDGLNGYATISTITGMSANVRKKIALRIDGSALSTFANGSKIGSDYTAPSTFDIDEIDFSTLGFKIHDMRFYNEALTDQELINLTKI